MGHVRRTIASIAAASAMILISLGALGTDALAAESALPDKAQFATVEELQTFDTADADDGNGARIRFGKDGRRWWIAGSQQGNLTLFAASPLLTNQVFESNWKNDKTYSSGWNCTYPDGAPESVYPNHYGASPLRDTLRGLESSYFSSAEQSLMNETTVYTYDLKNKSVYATTDTLYLAYGDYNETDITVGENGPDDLNGGLRIDQAYFCQDEDGNKSKLWLRTPGTTKGNPTVGYWVLATTNLNYTHSNNTVNLKFGLSPAFELDLSSVAFASAVPAVSSEGNQPLDDAFTLRCSAWGHRVNVGAAVLSDDKTGVTVTGVPADRDVYLVAQNAAGAQAKRVAADTGTVSAADMGLDSFEACRVWLETTDTASRLTYAREAGPISVSIAGNTGLSIASANGEQAAIQPGSQISAITVGVAEGYYLSEDYIAGLNSLAWNGLTVTRTDAGFTISGTPTSDVNLVLPAAATCPKAATPTVSVEATPASITATVTNHEAGFGDIEYRWDNGAWKKDGNVLSNLQPNTTHQLAVRFTGKGIYQASEEYSVEITTPKRDGATVAVVPPSVTVTYREGMTLSDISLPEGGGWSWVDGSAALSAGTHSYAVALNTADLEDTTDFSQVSGYDPATHTVVQSVQVTVGKAGSAVTIATPSLAKAFDGTPVREPDVMTAGSGGAVAIRWQRNAGTADAPVWEDLASAPSAAGSYRVVVTLAENENYSAASSALEFAIARAVPPYELPTNVTAVSGQTLADVPLPEGFAWEDGALSVGGAGRRSFKAVFTPADTDNYETVGVRIAVTVRETGGAGGSGGAGGKADATGTVNRAGATAGDGAGLPETGDDARLVPCLVLLAGLTLVLASPRVSKGERG